jgi:hypothetical protein
MSRKVNFWEQGNKASVSGEERANILLLACCYQEVSTGWRDDVAPKTVLCNIQLDRARLIDVLTQLLQFIGYPRTLNALRVVDEVTQIVSTAGPATPNRKETL